MLVSCMSWKVMSVSYIGVLVEEGTVRWLVVVVDCRLVAMLVWCRGLVCCV